MDWHAALEYNCDDNLICFTLPVKSHHIDGLVQDCSNPSALAMELLHSCTKPSTYALNYVMPSTVMIHNSTGVDRAPSPGERL